jgi:hypothetical protein
VVRIVVANAVALVLLVAGWYHAAGAGDVRTQLTWLNLSLAGLAVSAVSNGLWLLRGRQVVGLARVAMLPDVPKRHANTSTLAPPGAVVTSKGMTRFHRPGCPLVAGRSVRDGSATALVERGLSPCEICEP